MPRGLLFRERDRELARAFLTMSYEEQRRLVILALGRILMRQKGNLCRVRPRCIALELGLPTTSGVSRTIAGLLYEIEELRVNGSRWFRGPSMRNKHGALSFYFLRKIPVEVVA